MSQANVCIKVVAVLRRARTVNNVVTFLSEYDDTGQTYRTLQLELDEWTGMGSPDAVTLTIEPGDQINGEGVTQETALGGVED